MVKKNQLEEEKQEEVANEEKVELVEKPEVVKPEIIELNPEQIESRQRAHDLKVAKFLAGGEF